MPHATNRYHFEWKVFNWAKSFSELLTGHPHFAFFISFSGEGRIQKIIVGGQAEKFSPSLLESLQQESSSWFFHDPFEGSVYTYIKWNNIDGETMERITGSRFEPGDFADEGNSIAFPVTWGVMY